MIFSLVPFIFHFGANNNLCAARRAQVMNQLPDKVEIVEHCALTSEQLELYHREVELGRKEIKNGGGEEERESGL